MNRMDRIPQVFVNTLSWIAFSLLILIWPSTLYALNVYSLVDRQCKIESGLIVYVDNFTVKMLNFEGQYVDIKRDTLDLILVYTTLHNPIAQIDVPLDSELLKNVYLADDDTPQNNQEPSFVGWPIRFLGNLVEFYDLNGELHLVEIEQIFKITPNKEAKEQGNRKQRNALNYQETILGYQNNISDCLTPSTSPRQIYPIRILSDKINISKFLANFQNGYEHLNEFGERITYYAKPILFEEGIRLGVGMLPDPPQEGRNAGEFGGYLQWGHGAPYHYQGKYKFGYTDFEGTPLLEPVSGFSADVKFHFFRASLIVNASSVGGGEKYFSNQALGLETGDPFILNEKIKIPEEVTLGSVFPVFKEKEPRLAMSYNYLLMLGGEQGPYSFSLGSFYPIYGFRVASNFREVLAVEGSPIIRFLYLTEKYGYKITFSNTEYQTKNPQDNRVSLLQRVSLSDPTFIKNNELLERDPSLPYRIIEQYQFQSYFIRLGGEYYLDDELIFSLDLISVTGLYDEKIAQVENSNTITIETNHFAFDHKKISFSVKKELGQYFAIKGVLNYFQRDYQTRFSDENEGIFESTFTSGGAVEFIF